MRVNSYVTHLQLKKMSVMSGLHMMQSLSNYLKGVLSQHATKTILNIRTFFEGFLRENVVDFTYLHNESIWKFRVNGIVSVTGTRVNIYQISLTWQPYSLSGHIVSPLKTFEKNFLPTVPFSKFHFIR